MSILEWIIALWATITIVLAALGFVVWAMGITENDKKDRQMGARLVIACWAWPMLLAVVVRDAFRTTGRN